MQWFVMPDGVERVLHGARAADVLPQLAARFGWQRVAVICSRSLRTQTPAVQELEAALGTRCVLVLDEVGEHAPIGNILRAAQALRGAAADGIVALGGGSVLDFCKFVQICLAENVRDAGGLRRLEWRVDDASGEILPSALTPPAVRTIAVPTTLATAEWTPGGTPVDEVTRIKARIAGVRAAPLAIVYDPDLLALTPYPLLVATGVRGLDHAINTALAEDPHPFASVLAEKAIGLWFDGLPRARRRPALREAMEQLQLAAWFSGFSQAAMATRHGFSHWMTHILAPLAGVAHSDMACVLMLAQARWFEPAARERYGALLAALGRAGEGPFSELLQDLLHQLGMPTRWNELGIGEAVLEESVALAVAHPLVTRSNLRPIRTADDVRAVLALGA